MSKGSTGTQGAEERLIATGYWPAMAAQALDEGKYSRAVEICRGNMDLHDESPLSASIIYARAMYHAGQTDSCRNLFYGILARDADNLVALKYLGDLCYAQNDEVAAMAHYRRILEIDPQCRGLQTAVNRPERPATKTRTVTLKSRRESKKIEAVLTPPREVPIYSETVGDLYLSQGYPRLAIHVYEKLSGDSNNPRLADKINKARLVLTEKEK